MSCEGVSWWWQRFKSEMSVSDIWIYCTIYFVLNTQYHILYCSYYPSTRYFFKQPTAIIPSTTIESLYLGAYSDNLIKL